VPKENDSVIVLFRNYHWQWKYSRIIFKLTYMEIIFPQFDAFFMVQWALGLYGEVASYNEKEMTRTN
jgi:hypothetical protein